MWGKRMEMDAKRMSGREKDKKRMNGWKRMGNPTFVLPFLRRGQGRGIFMVDKNG